MENNRRVNLNKDLRFCLDILLILLINKKLIEQKAFEAEKKKYIETTEKIADCNAINSELCKKIRIRRNELDNLNNYDIKISKLKDEIIKKVKVLINSGKADSLKADLDLLDSVEIEKQEHENFSERQINELLQKKEDNIVLRERLLRKQEYLEKFVPSKNLDTVNFIINHLKTGETYARMASYTYLHLLNMNHILSDFDSNKSGISNWIVGLARAFPKWNIYRLVYFTIITTLANQDSRYNEDLRYNSGLAKKLLNDIAPNNIYWLSNKSKSIESLSKNTQTLDDFLSEKMTLDELILDPFFKTFSGFYNKKFNKKLNKILGDESTFSLKVAEYINYANTKLKNEALELAN